MTYLTLSERENLLKYKYKGGDQSYVYAYILSPWAQFCVDMTPTWVAPNLITFVGLCLPITSLILTLLYNPTLEADTQPAWLSIFTGCGIFIYQTLDNMDGKQARKTGSSSPLGMLFDHGCDAMNAVISPITVSAVYGTGWTTKLFLTYGCSTIPFFLQTWEEFYVGEMFLPVINGPSEGLLFTVATCFATSQLGSAWWHVPSISFPRVPYAVHAVYITLIGIPSDVISTDYLYTPFQVNCLFGCILVSITTLTNITKVLSRVLAAGDSIVNPVRDLCPFYIWFLSAFVAAHFSSIVLSEHEFLFSIAIGSSFVEMLVHIMLVHITHNTLNTSWRVLSWMMPVLAVLCYNEYYTAKYYTKFPHGDSDRIISNSYVYVTAYLYFYAMCSACYTIFIMYEVVTEFSQILNIYVFSLRKRTRRAGSKIA